MHMHAQFAFNNFLFERIETESSKLHHYEFSSLQLEFYVNFVIKLSCFLN